MHIVESMLERIHEVDASSVSISDFAASPTGHFFITVEYAKDGSGRCDLKLTKTGLHEEVFEVPIAVDISSLCNFDEAKSCIQFVAVTRPVKGKIEHEHFIVLSTHDGIHAVPCTGLFTLADFGEILKPVKWRHLGLHDRINSFWAFNVPGSYLHIVYCTRLGSIVKLSLNVDTCTFTKISEIRNQVGDSLNTCTPCLPTARETEIIEVPELVFSCFDNKVYILEGNKLEKFTITDLLDDEKTLISAQGAIAKRYSTRSLRFYVANVTNSGCHLFRRRTGSDWDLVHIFERDFKQTEKCSVIDCQLVWNGISQLRIISGSENGKIYIWKYDTKREMITDSETLKVASSNDYIHDLKVLNDHIYFLINQECIGKVFLH
ncbi:LAMI_0B03312g1_1 [Lachancea mirantina]|uniref:LAMI_0B03312g1_1 n=1 Tax=Lachancea mirantina TaxID=1230905 RepID=A0A1G4IUL7_9SACH|nr:LAMI_0B03312g1_1 [Lachancea mirantina]